MANRTIWFYDEIYKANWLFCVGDSKWFIDYMNKKYRWIKGLDYSDIDWADAKCWSVPYYGIVIFLHEFKLNPRWVANLTHEIIHGVFFTLDGKIEITAENSEAFTYYAEGVQRMFLNRWKQKT